MQKYAVIVAGGNGLRMGAFIPKQFLMLKGKPVLWYTINTFLQSYSDMQIILVLPEEHIERGEEIVAMFDQQNRVAIIKGGSSRFHSVQNGLKMVSTNSIVFVHDGVRCLVSANLIKRCYEQALAKGSAIPAIAATDSIRIVEGVNNFVADRANVRMIQTPQTFSSDIILPAFAQVYNDAFTDEATVIEAAGTDIFLCEGEYSNIKITRPVDLLMAENFLEEL